MRRPGGFIGGGASKLATRMERPFGRGALKLQRVLELAQAVELLLP